jgi:hypothetical protein
MRVCVHGGAGEGFFKLLNEVFEEEIVVHVPHTHPRFLNPGFMVPMKEWK